MSEWSYVVQMETSPDVWMAVPKLNGWMHAYPTSMEARDAVRDLLAGGWRGQRLRILRTHVINEVLEVIDPTDHPSPDRQENQP